MTAAEKHRFRDFSQRVTFIVANQRDEIRALKGALDDIAFENEQLSSENAVLKDAEKDCRYRIIELKGDLSAKDIEIRRLENEILRLKMIVDEKV